MKRLNKLFELSAIIRGTQSSLMLNEARLKLSKETKDSIRLEAAALVKAMREFQEKIDLLIESEMKTTKN